MGTPEFALPAFSALIDAGHNIVAVYTQPPRPSGRGQKLTPTPVHQFALQHNIAVYTPLSLKSEQEQATFAGFNADAAIVAAYGLLLPQAILYAPKLGCINIHPSLLPRWRGAAPIQRTIMAGDSETGVVIMQMEAGLDSGDMLAVEKFAIADGTTAGELHDKLAQISAPLLLNTLQEVAEGRAKPIKQGDAGLTYAAKILKAEGKIDWADSAQNIRNKILGLAPAPCAFFNYKDEVIKLLKADILKTNSTYTPGEVIDDNLSIACGENAITNIWLQRPGKKPMPASEMLKSYKIAKGEVLA